MEKQEEKLNGGGKMPEVKEGIVVTGQAFVIEEFTSQKTGTTYFSLLIDVRGSDMVKVGLDVGDQVKECEKHLGHPVQCAVRISNRNNQFVSINRV